MTIDYYTALEQGYELISQEELEELFEFYPYEGVILQADSEALFTTWVHKGISYPKEALLWFMHYQYWPDQFWHLDGKESNKRIDNLMCDLRLAEMSQASGLQFTDYLNRYEPLRPLPKKRRQHRKCKVQGVFWDTDKHKWRVRMMVEGVYHSLGYYEELWDAICARMSAAVRLETITPVTKEKKKLTFRGRPPTHRKLIWERKQALKAVK